MDWLGVFAWGLCATVAMTVIESLGLWMGLTRMSTPILLGTALTGNRDRALLFGTGAHLIVGLLFALLYTAVFEAAGSASWWFGAGLGVGHQLFMTGIVLPALPAIHPRMASERHGPEPTRSIQPPGFLAFNYGRRTLIVGLLSHIVYGVILGGMYRVQSSAPF